MSLSMKAEDLLDALMPLASVYRGAGSLQSKIRLTAAEGVLTARAAATPSGGSNWIEGERKAEKLKGALDDLHVDFKPLVGMVALTDSPSDPVEMEVEGTSLRVSTPHFRTRLPIVPAKEVLAGKSQKIPPFNTVNWDPLTTTTWSAPNLSRPFKFVATATSADYARPILNNVKVHRTTDGKIALAGTDSYRLAMLELPAEAPPTFDEGFLLPRGVGNFLPDEEAEFTFHTAENRPFAWTEWDKKDTHWRVQIPVDSPAFPNYRSLIPPSHPVVINLDRDAALRSFTRAQRFAKLVNVSATGSPMVLEVSPDGLVIKLSNRAYGDESDYYEYLHCDTGGANMKAAFNVDYFIAGIKAIEHPVVSISMFDGAKPALISSEGFSYLVMPVRLS